MVPLTTDYSQPTQPQQPQRPQQPQGREPNWWEKLLPTAGGILGGVATAPLEALDAVSGVGGTALNVAGAAGGSALGKALEDKLTGQARGNGVLESAIEGGAGAGVGGILGKAAGAGLGAIGRGLGGMAERRAATQSLADFSSLFPKEAINNKLVSHSDLLDSKNLLEGAGIKATPQAFVGASNAGSTVAEDALNGALSKSNPVDLNATYQAVDNALSKSKGVLGQTQPTESYVTGRGVRVKPTDASALQGQIRDMLQEAGFGGQGSVTGQVPATSARDFLVTLQKAAAEAKPTADVNTGVVDPKLQAKYNVLNDTAQSIKKLIYNTPEAKQAISDIKGNLTPEDVMGMSHDVFGKTDAAGAGIPMLTKDEAAALADHLNGVLTKAKTPQDILDSYSQFVKMNQAGKPALDWQTKVSPLRPGGEAATTDLIGPAASTAAGIVHPTAGIAAKGVNALGNMIPNLGAKAAGAGSSILGGIAPVLGPLGTQAGAALGNLSGAGIAAAKAGENNQGGGGMPPTAGAPGGGGGAGWSPGQSTASVGGGPAMANGSPMGTAQLAQQLDQMMAGNPALASSLAPVLQALVSQITSATAAQQALGQYQGTLGQATAGGGPIGSLMAKIGGALTGGPATAVAPEQQGVAALLKQAGLPGMTVPGLYQNQAGTAAGMAPVQSALSAITGQ